MQSCVMNSEIVYHRDAASTSVIDFDTREFMAEMKAMTPDSLQQNEFKDFDKLPTSWISLYDLEKQEGKLSTHNQDSIKIMKKIFMKNKKENNESVGFTFKMEHFTRDDYQIMKSFNKEEKLPADQNIFNEWDGKTLVINSESFNLKNIEEALRSKSPKEEADRIPGMMGMFFRKISTTLRFENKIKSVTGQHDWLKQTDDYSVKIDYDLKAMYNKKTKLKHADEKIIIVTE